MEPEYVARGWWGNDTLSGWLARHAAGRPDGLAVSFDGAAITWKSLEDQVLRVAQGLTARGVARPTRKVIGARDMEVELAIALREKGYGVWQG